MLLNDDEDGGVKSVEIEKGKLVGVCTTGKLEALELWTEELKLVVLCTEKEPELVELCILDEKLELWTLDQELELCMLKGEKEL